MRNSLKNFGCGFAPDPAPDALVTLCSPAQQAPWGSMVPPAKKTLGNFVKLIFLGKILLGVHIRLSRESGRGGEERHFLVGTQFKKLWSLFIIQIIGMCGLDSKFLISIEIISGLIYPHCKATIYFRL